MTRGSSRAEEVELARRIEQGDLRAEQQMIESNLGLVHAIARNYLGSGVPLTDLVQEGTVGLVHAVKRFDHHRGVKFSTYAVWWIRRSILDAIANSAVIRVPSKANQQLAAVRRAESELARVGPRHASDAQIAEHAQLRETTVRSLRSAAHVTASLDQPIGDDNTPLGELVADERPSIRPIPRSRGRTSASSRRCCASCPPATARSSSRRFGLADHAVQNHQQIAEWLGVGEERSRQIEREALHRLRSIAGTTRRAA